MSTCTHADIHVCSLVNIHTCMQRLDAHTHQDCWQAEIVTMTSGSALKTAIGPEYSLSLDGAFYSLA